MKKLFSMFTMVALSAALLAACSTKVEKEATTEAVIKEETLQNETEIETELETDTEKIAESESPEDRQMKIGALKGPTAMGLVKVMADSDEAQEQIYDFSIVTAIDEITAGLVKGDLDIATVPANVASVLYNNTDGKIQVMGINTLGVLYVVETGNSIETVEDLRGKTIYTTGKGATPEYALNYVLLQNGLTPGVDVEIEFKSEAAECVSILVQDEKAIAMLPQPFVTTAQMNNENIKIALDLTAEWDKVQGAEATSTLITGVIVGRREFIENNQEVVNQFLDEYAISVSFVNENVEEAAALIEYYDIIKAQVASKAIPYCNITLIEGVEMEEKLLGYLEVLHRENPESIGGAIPNATFYYFR